MKITIVLGAFFPVPTVMGGAVEKIWLILAEEFARQGHSVTMISRAWRDFPNEEVRHNVRHLRVSGFDAPGSLLWLKWLDLVYSRRVRSRLPSADILVTNTFWLPLLVKNPDSGRLYVHVARFPKGQLRWYDRAARLQAPSSAITQAIKEQAPHLAGKTVVIPYPAPERPAGGVKPINEREKVMLYVGRVHPEKGVHLLVRAFAANARTLFADWKLVIVGPTEEKFGGGGAAYLGQLKEAARNASDQVHFAGSIFDSQRLAERLAGARLFVYPSLAETGETFGVAPLEAMAQGCAVLVSSLACFRDFIADGSTGFIFDHRVPDPVDSLTNRLRSIVGDETMLARVAQAGYEKTADYAASRVAEMFLRDFDSVMQDSQRSAFVPPRPRVAGG